VEFALALVAFAPAAAIGSFLNVVAGRLPNKMSLVRPRSACPSCGHEIAWHDNVPLLSYMLLRGKCRSCQATISVRYPLVELTTAVLVAACFFHFGLTADALVASYVCAALVVLSAIDLEHRILPDRITLPSAGIVLVANTLIHPGPQWAIASLGAALFLFLAVLAYPRGMGMGDVKLALLMGAACGKTVPVAMAIGMVSALVPSIVLLVRYGAAARKMAIPFGPFLALGTVVTLFIGDWLLGLYTGLL